MIRTSKHRIDNISNKTKLIHINYLLDSYKCDLNYYINLILSNHLPLKTNLSSKLLPVNNLKHSKYRRICYKQASEIIRSGVNKAKEKRYKKYKKIYKYFKDNGRQIKFTNKKYKELNLNDIIYSKYFTKPNLNNITINLTNEFFNIKTGKYFDNFINIKLPVFNEKGTRALQINLPLKYHKQSNKLSQNNFKLRNTIQIKKCNNKIYINLIWEKDVKLKEEGNSLGIDIGYKKLMVTSDSEIIGNDMELLYNKISNKKQGSRNYKELLIHRDNIINYHVNNMNLNNINKLIIEDLKKVKYKTKGKINRKFNNKLQRWTYRKLIEKLERICEENGIELVKVSPAYTSQTCSSCGNINKNSRKGEEFNCISCGYEIDADLNASINIHNRGVYSPSDKLSIIS